MVYRLMGSGWGVCLPVAAGTPEPTVEVRGLQAGIAWAMSGLRIHVCLLASHTGSQPERGLSVAARL